MADAGLAALRSRRSVPSDAADALLHAAERLEQGIESAIARNELAKHRLDEARASREAREHALSLLEARLHQARDNRLDPGVQAQLDRLMEERGRFAREIDTLARRLGDTANRGLGDELPVARTQRTSALEELADAEAQLERAVRLVADLRTRLSVTREEWDELRARVATTEERLESARGERDLLAARLEDSRAAVQSLRRTLSAAEWRRPRAVGRR